MRSLLFLLLGTAQAALAAVYPAPTGLTAQATGSSGAVALNWAAVTSPPVTSGYKLYRATYPVGVSLTTATVVTTTALTDNGVDGQNYWYAVQVNTTDTADVSLTVTAAPFAAPDAPVLTGSAASFGRGLALTWTTPTLHGFALGAYRVEAMNGAAVAAAITVPAGVNTALVSRPCGATQTVQVRAVDVLGNLSSPSAQVQLAYPCAPIVTVTSLSSRALALGFTALPSGMSSNAQVELRSATYTGAAWADQTSLVTLTGSATLGGITTAALTEYAPLYLRLYSTSADGVTSAASNEIVPLAAATGLTGVARSGRVTLGWTNAVNVSALTPLGYELYYATYTPPAPGAPSTTALYLTPTVSGSSSSVTVTGLTNGTLYHFALSTVGGQGSARHGELSSVVGLTPRLPSPVITSFLQVEGGALNIGWSSVDATPNTAVGYVVGHGDATLSSVAFEPAVTSTTLALTPPVSGSYWFVGAVSGPGEQSDLTPTASTLFAPALTAPVNFQALTANGRVQLSWDPVVNANEYQVYRATQGGIRTTKPAWIVNATTLIDTFPSNGQANDYVVLARRNLGLNGSKVESPASVTLTVAPAVGPGIPGTYFAWGPGTELTRVRVVAAYLTATANAAGNRVDLSWTASAAGSRLIANYRVYSGLSAGSLSLLATLPASVTTYSQALADPLNRVYGVDAIDTQGLVSPLLTGTASANVAWPAPRTPSAFTLGSKALLSWYAPASAGNHAFAGYVVSALDLTNGASAVLATVTYTSYSDLSLPQTIGSVRTYGIRVIDSAGQLGAQTTVSVSYNPTPTGALPGAVQNVQAKVLTGTSMPVLLSWQAAPLAEQVTGYVVYRDGSFLATTQTAAYLDSATTATAAYSYSVQAVNAVGSGATTTASPLPLIIYPPQVGGVKASFAVDASGNTWPALSLTWNDVGVPTGADAYEVYRSTGDFVDLSSSTDLGAVTVTAFTDVSLTPGTYYNYLVLGKVAGVIELSPTAALALSVTAAAAPVAPSSLTAITLSTGVRLTWTAQAQAREYWVYRSTQSFGVYPGFSPLTRVSTASYSDTPLSTAFTYYYGVAAANELAVGPAALLATETAPGTVTGLTATAGYAGGRQIALAWTAPASPALAASYQVRRAQALSAFANNTASLFGPVTTTSFVDSAVSAGTAYYYEVSALSGTAYSTGNPIVGPLRAFDPPSTVLGLSAVGALGRVTAVWDAPVAPDAVTGYAVTVLRDPNFGVSYTAMVTGQSFSVTGLAAAEGVTLSVLALNTAGAASATASAFAVANAVGPVAQPVTFNAKVGFFETSAATLRVLLTWSQTAAGQSILLYRDTAPIPLAMAQGGASSPLYLTGLGSAYTSLTDAAVSSAFTYYYAMSLVGSSGSMATESLPLRSIGVSPFSYPSRVTLTAQGGLGRVDLTWSSPTFVGSGPGLYNPPYRLYRYTTTSTTSVHTISAPDAGFPIDLTTNAYVDASVAVGTSYQYVVAVIDAQGREQKEQDLNFVAGVKARDQGAAPDAILAIPGDRSVSLRWLAYSPETALNQKFNVYRRDSSSDYGAPVPSLYQVGPSTVQEYAGLSRTVVTLRDDQAPNAPVNKTTYCYSIALVNEFGEGGKSPEVCATPYRLLKPIDPRLTLAVTGKKDVVLTWDNSVSNDAESFGPNAGFRLYRSLDGGTTYTLLHSGLLPVTLTAYSDVTTDFGASYVYRLVPVDTAGQDGVSYNLASVIIPSAKNAVLLFRNSFNPAGGEVVPVQFSLLQPGHAWVRVYTLRGDFVASLFEEDVDTASAETPYLSQKKAWDGKNADGQIVASGVYLVHLEAPGYRANARVAVIK